ncbi:MAG: dihydrodipicolinate synthase family protein [Chloroflexota bacterium]
MTHPDELRARLPGVIAFPCTPFTEHLELDESAFRRNLRMLVDSGIKIVLVAGGTGELYSLTPTECVRLYLAAVEECRGKAMVIGGVGFGSAIARDLAREAEQAGVDGILMLPPYYGEAEPKGLVAYYSHIAAATSLGVFPYARNWARLSPDMLAELARVPNVVAFKDGQGDLRLWAQLRARIGERLVWLGGVGDDLVDLYFAAGAQGFTSSMANLDPRIALNLYAAASSGDLVGARAIITHKVLPIYEIRTRGRGYEVSVMKAAMDLLGLAGGPVRPPLVDCTAEERALIAQALETSGIWLAPGAAG